MSKTHEFKRGDWVWVERLRKEGIVEGKTASGSIQVRVGSFLLDCPPGSVRKVDLKKGKKKTPLTPRRAAPDYRNPDSRKVLSIDLHGKTVEDAIRELDGALSRALFEGYGRLDVVHGLGTGKVRAAVHAHLDLLAVASHYKVDEANPGLTRVYFSA